jgi:2-amino-4-hydroxy-6-hydroxymethyldihydropteridine diphosphokinase
MAGVVLPALCCPAWCAPDGPVVPSRRDSDGEASTATYASPVDTGWSKMARAMQADAVEAGPSRVTGRARSYIGLGANLGDASSTMAAAVHALAALPGARLRGVSRLYRTRPVGVADQPDFHNAVVAVDVPTGPDPEAGALALLVALKELERAFGRRPRRHWGPRELDLDLILFGRHRFRVDRPTSDGGDRAPGVATWLEVPHPAAQERLFVLAPLGDLAPRSVPPGWPETVEAARRRRERAEGPDAVVPIGRWDPAAGRWR